MPFVGSCKQKRRGISPAAFACTLPLLSRLAICKEGQQMDYRFFNTFFRKS